MYLESPKPDVQLLMDILTNKRKSTDVKYMELIIDDEVLAEYCANYLKRSWIPYQRENLELRAKYWDNVIECYYRLGYSGFRVSNALTFQFNRNKSEDTALFSRGEREWSNHEGVIKDFASFDNYPWPSIEDIDLWDYYYVNDHLPKGMGIFACVYGGIFEMLCEYLVGFEELSYMYFDNPDLLEQIVEKVGNLLIEAYKKIILIEKVVCIFQGDDLGYTSGLMFSPSFYEQYVFPWHKELANLAHSHHKLYLLHSCGNLRDIKQELIDLGIDAKHSYEEKGWSVIDFYQEMHPHMGVIGGVDVDKLCRLGDLELEEYCLHILESCTKNGRYVFGSGNSIANYVPLEKFLLMLKVAHNYQIKE